MDKKALEVDPTIVARYGLGGLLAGGSTMAVLNLVRMLREMHAKQRELAAEPETSEDQIVLTLPRRKMAAEKKEGPPTKIRRVEHTRITVARGPKKNSQFRRAYDGTFGCKTAATGWPTLTTAALAALGGSALGAHVVNKIYQTRRQKQLQAELEAAQQEYMDMLQTPKTAECLDALFALPMEKEGDRTFGPFNYLLASAALMSILGAGGTAYITKRILDEKFREAQRRGLDIPKVRRIVFRSQPATDEEGEEKTGTAEDIECIKAALGVMMDRVGGETKILTDPQVKEAMEKAGTSVPRLFKLAADVDLLIEYLRQNPRLRQLIQRTTMAQHPLLRHFRWATSIPGVSNLVDHILYKQMQKHLTPGAPVPFWKAVKQTIQPHASAATEYIKRLKPFGKQAVVLGMLPEVVSSVIGSTIANRAAQPKAKSPEEEPTPAQTRKTVSKIKLTATDPEAQAYLEKNKAKVMAILRQMAAEGKI